MSKVVKVVLPQGTEEGTALDLSAELRRLEGVSGSGTTASRGLEIAALAVWLTVSSDAVGLANSAFELVQKIVDLVKGKGIQGVSIELPNGAKISVDRASAADIQKIVGALQGPVSN